MYAGGCCPNPFTPPPPPPPPRLVSSTGLLIIFQGNTGSCCFMYVYHATLKILYSVFVETAGAAPNPL